ncbi:cupin domain-containing protein [Desulfosporosinus sp. PR]|uniref:cupin domain-containing protein n=1 Tax=Candidatus Desulfosporosinus nitrosoreducens TaxID=3401928 RepID=UPI0027EA7CFB|nr:cupin domain-containing protein [Desulfosporosinus sp. PR]MDQ7095428.1 cupin domain-containing protein [Desulfosporosinus sp. PR]
MALRGNWENLERVMAREGVTRRVFGGNNSMMTLNEIMPGAVPALHSHPHEQISYIMKGKAEFVLGDEVLNLEEGDLLLIPPNVPHRLKVIGDETVLNIDIFSPIREDYLLKK